MDENKVSVAIGRIIMASDMAVRRTGCPLVVCVSGGKDSSVIQQLAIESGASVKFVHHLTTVDAPETVRFVRSEFDRLRELGYDAQIARPEKTMWQLIEEKRGFLPTRFSRYCCKMLKERPIYTDSGAAAFICTGVRWDESVKRRSRGEFERLGASKKDAIILVNDNDPDRKLFEDCKLKGTRVVNPIIDWVEDDVWQYLRGRGVPYNPLYDDGWHRVGCVGCPLASPKCRQRDFDTYPGYMRAYIAAIERGLARARETGAKVYFDSAESAFRNWLRTP